MKRKFYLTYPKEQIKEPLLSLATKRFDIVTNIRQATVTDAAGLVALEIDGESEEIEKAINFFTEKGVKVEPIELDIIE